MNTQNIKIWMAAGWLAMGGMAATAQTLYVPQNYGSIMAAINAAPHGSTIVVAPGRYYEFIDIHAPSKTLTIVGSAGAGSTFIDGQGSRLLAQINGQNADSAKQVTFDGISFVNGYHGGDASAVAVVDAKPRFINCIFSNNRTGQRGGAVRVLGGAAHPAFINCQFLNNTVVANGGGAVLVNASGAQADFQQCVFDGNSTVTPSSPNVNHGAGIYFSAGGGRVINCTFRNNKSTYTSGAIMVLNPFGQTQRRVDIVGCRFENNYTERNPAAALPPGGPPTEGGAVMVEDNVDVYIENSYFYNNRSMAGGAVHSYRARLTIKNSVFDSNVANGSNYLGYGGAIGANSNEDPNGPDNPSAYLFMENCMVRNCTAPVGGGISYTADFSHGTASSTRGTVVLNNVVVENCRASQVNSSYGSGGGLHFAHANVSANALYILNNRADQTGGAIVIDQNTALTLNNSYLVGNSAGVSSQSIYILASPNPTLNSTVQAYNGGFGTASGSALIAAPPVTVQGKAYLAWFVGGYQGSPALNPGVGVLPNKGGFAAGSAAVSISANTTFSLTSQHSTKQASVTAAAVVPPRIKTWMAMPHTRKAGGVATLYWQVENAPSSLTVSGIGAISGDQGSIRVTISGAASYTLTAINDAGVDSKTVNVGINSALTDERFFLTGNFDGREGDDICYFWKDYAMWYMLFLPDPIPVEHQLGWNATIPAPADYDGDGTTDMAVYYPATGTWYVNQSRDGFKTFNYGWWETIPVPADYDGDGRVDVAVYFPAGGMWYINQSRDGFVMKNWGWGATKPVPADFDGDGRVDLAVYWPETGLWFIDRTSEGYQQLQFGWADADPVPADYDGDGQADIAVYYKWGGMWYMLKSRDGFETMQFGWSGSRPKAADYDADGRADLTVYADGEIFRLRTSAGFEKIHFGW